MSHLAPTNRAGLMMSVHRRIVAKVENRTTPEISQMLIFGQLRHCDALQRQYEGPWWFFCETMRSLTSRGGRRIRGPQEFSLGTPKILLQQYPE